jgi:hypothetical protein
MLEITNAAGQHRFVRIAKFAALDGWDIQQRFIEFAISHDKAFRKKFAVEILRYATVVNGDLEIPLITDALVDNHLQSWQNVQLVFEAVLMDNGIDPKTHAERPNYWADAGAIMAATFIEEVYKWTHPAVGFFTQLATSNEPAK